jgi:hypothetical protein
MVGGSGLVAAVYGDMNTMICVKSDVGPRLCRFSASVPPLLGLFSTLLIRGPMHTAATYLLLSSLYYLPMY